MKIKISGGYYATTDGKLLGYLGEIDSREIIVEGYETEGADLYKIRLSYDDGYQYDVVIEDGKAEITASMLRSVGTVKVQVLAVAVDIDSEIYTYIKKSNIFTAEIKPSLNGEAIPTYEQSVEALEKVIAKESEADEYAQQAKTSAQNAEIFSQQAQEMANNADQAKTAAEGFAKNALSAQTAAGNFANDAISARTAAGNYAGIAGAASESAQSDANTAHQARIVASDAAAAAVKERESCVSILNSVAELDRNVTSNTKTASDAATKATNSANTASDRAGEAVDAGFKATTAMNEAIKAKNAANSAADRAEDAMKDVVRSVNNVKPDANGNVNVSGGGGSVTVDTELSLTSENPVQNKIVTGAINEIEKKQGTIEVEENAYDFYNLPNSSKVIQPIPDSSLAGYTSKLLYGKNYFINTKEYAVSSPLNGITFKAVDDRRTSIKGTVTAQTEVIFRKDGENYIKLEDLGIAAGDELSLGCYASGTVPNDSIIIRVYLFNGKTQLSVNQIFPKLGSIPTKYIAIPNNATDIMMSFVARNGYTIDGTVIPYLIKISDALVDFTNTTTLDDNTTIVSSFPCKSKVTYNKNLQAYIDEHSGASPEEIYGLITYVTPEQFGAVGDYATNDTNAIRECISYAKANKMPVKMLKSYVITSSIEIDYDYADVEINRINYTGNDSAIILNCSNGTFKFDTVKSSFIGIKMVGDRVRCTRNRLQINTIETAHHGIVLHSINKSIYQNEIRFMWIYGGNNSGDYGITSHLYPNTEFVTENNFYGGHVQRVDWAWYGEGGSSKFYSIHVEDSNGGFFFPSDCNALIIGDRHAEAEIFSSSPYIKIGDGTTKLSETNQAGNGQLRYITSSALYLNSIDISSKQTTYLFNGVTYPIDSRSIGYIDSSITGGLISKGSGSRESNYNILTNGAFIWGEKLIFKPFIKCTKNVNSNLDLRANDSNLKVLPTTFSMKSSSVIRLHASYCFIGYSQFNVIQTETNKATIYDCDGNLIFDGESKEAGIYSVTHELTSDDGIALYDGTGTEWIITKLS